MYIRRKDNYIVAISEIKQEDMVYIDDNDKELQDYRNHQNQYSYEEIQKRTLDYKQLRAIHYPSIGDMIDAFCKAKNGDDSELNKLLKLREEIKNTYKKGE